MENERKTFWWGGKDFWGEMLFKPRVKGWVGAVEEHLAVLSFPKRSSAKKSRLTRDVYNVSGQNSRLEGSFAFLLGSYSLLDSPVPGLILFPTFLPSAWTNCLMLVSILEKWLKLQEAQVAAKPRYTCSQQLGGLGEAGMQSWIPEGASASGLWFRAQKRGDGW